MDEIKAHYNNTKVTVMQGDITKLKVDAIVNAANTKLRGGGGVDGAIHRAGGPVILEECKKYDGCPTGEARITSAGNMPSCYVIHTVGPVYRGGKKKEAEQLSNAYKNSLYLALENKVKTIAFPFISAGVYGYPKDEASDIAINEIISFINRNPSDMDEIIFCCFSEGDYKIFKNKIQLKIK
jgi:O-acetyl-ADP-ribose deacetylase (regulator of RNase III)